MTKQKELEELKSAFISSVSHELRTPLSNIQESIKLILDRLTGDISPQQEKILTIAFNNTQRLARSIDNLLNLAQLQAERFSLKPIPFALDAAIENVVKSFLPWSQTKQITIEHHVQGPINVKADEDKLMQVLINLISNALNFTPSGGKVNVFARKKSVSGAQNDLIEIGVQDTGSGIPKKDLDKLFQKFVQLKTPKQQSISGTGLGLVISKQIVELHGGRIWAESKEGKGSRFLFEIPLK